MNRREVIMGVLALGVGGCSIGARDAAPVAVYDLGIEPPATTAARVRTSIALDEISASAWLHTPAILYRLAYRDPAQLQPYALSRWAAAPAVLMTQRLRLALGHAAERGVTMVAEGVTSEHVLRTDLTTFEQVIDTPAAGRGVVRARASIISASDRSLRAQRMFSAERPSPSIDAHGAVRALTAAADAVIEQVIEWVAAETAKRR
jgi:cholesterol transport system auxiliary component